MFEYFRESHVPKCENIEDVPDIFNDASGTDREPEVEEEESGELV